MLIVRGVNMFPTQVEELVLKIAQLAPHTSCARTGNMDELEILTEVRAEFSTLSDADPRGAGQGTAAARGQDASASARASGVGRGPCRAHADRQGARRVIDKRPK